MTQQAMHIAQWAVAGLLAYAATAVVLTWLLWLFYLATMSLWRVELSGKQTDVAQRFAAPLLAIGKVLGLSVNTLVMTVVLLELPREMAVSTRLARHLHKPDADYRTRVAEWFAWHLLDAYDPRGYHI
jgi:hypothetical protein